MGNQPAHNKSSAASQEGQTADAWEQMNRWGSEGTPFFFLVDFTGQQVEVYRLDELAGQGVLFDIQGFSNVNEAVAVSNSAQLEKEPISFAEYRIGFDLIQKHLRAGDTFLTNYTCATPIKTALSLREIFQLSRARYKVFFKEQFTFFSPETFVQIENGTIKTFPMKGTIDAAIPGAWAKILADQKEKAEHHTIVDLLRNDLSQVARQVQVRRFRYVEEIRTQNKHLLQVSSEITGQLPTDWRSQLGTIFQQLLPAGSISGAPKKKTVEIIQAAEQQDRGFYTGVVGVFDGEKVDSGVAIRFIEKTPDGLQFRSGGGITCFSDPQLEYQEMIDKVYLTEPTNNVPSSLPDSSEILLACS